MAQANIVALTSTYTGDFTIAVTFDAAYNGVDASIFTLTPLWGNGITDVMFSVLGSDTNYNLIFQLPTNVEGSFRIEITGMVTPVGSNVPESVMAAAAIVTYDNTPNVSASFGAVEYREGGVIAIPVNFDEGVIASKSVFKVTRTSGDILEGTDYILLGEGTAHELVFSMPPDRRGRFEISADGNVLKTATGVWDNVVIAAVTVDYSTIEPELVDHRIVRTGERVDVILQYSLSCTLTDPKDEFGSDDATRADFLDYAGANLDPPNFYRKVGDDFPTEFPLPAELLEADWTQSDLTTAEATIYLLRWDSVSENADFNVTIKPGFVQGPVS